MPDHQHPQKPSAASPKRFFRGFNSSPFKSGTHSHSRNNSAHNPLKNGENDGHSEIPAQGKSTASSSFDFNVGGSPSLSPNYRFHARSQSHDIAGHTRLNPGSPNWTQLIPPLPSSPGPNPGEIGASEVYGGPKLNQNSTPLLTPVPGPKSTPNASKNRHTIAVSPNATMLIPDMLQPSAHPDAERSFVLNSDSYGNSPFYAPKTGKGADSPLQRPQGHVGPALMSSGSFSSAEKAADYSKNAKNSKNSFDESNSTPVPGQRARSGSRNIKTVLATVPPQTPPPKPQNPQNKPDFNNSQSQLAPPPLVSRGSSKAVTMLQGQDSSTSLASGQETFSGDAVGTRKEQEQQNQATLAHLQQKARRPSGKKRKTCNSCNLVISGQFVRALNHAYHLECFKCYECGALCSAKFFPHEVLDENGSKIQVPLCEYDYFKKLSLICHSCDSALRGPYITALGNKYHLEHFKCYACGKVFESDESYYEHENSVYCHLHYSRLFATKCEGCHSSIVKQFVELFKSGKLEQWHPECYMVYKFWNVSVTVDSVGLPLPNSAESKSGLISNETSAKDLVLTEQRVEAAVMDCWVVLSGFEETSAARISEMLLAACSGKRMAGLATTGRLVLALEVLFKGLDYVQHMCSDFRPEDKAGEAYSEEIYSVDAFDKFQALRKEPRNISGKLMSYLAILRKSHNISESGSLSSELLAVITGCAHYLKLLIRIGLSNALALNRLRGDTKALDGFLHLVRAYEDADGDQSRDIPGYVSPQLAVPYNATDACCVCTKSVEKACVALENMRWHHKCFECVGCHRKPSAELKLESFLGTSKGKVFCSECVKADKNPGSSYTSGFVKVTDLSQLLFLLKIALSRSKAAIKKEAAAVDLKPNAAMNHIAEDPTETEATFSKTLDEVTSLRQKRESRALRTSVKKNARKSVVLEAPMAVTAKTDDTSAENERIPTERKGSSSSGMSFTVSRRDSDLFDFHTNPVRIRDDPPQRMASNSLDRTSDLLKNEKSLTLDDIPRIVAAEQARDQRPNAFKHHNSLYQKRNQPIKSVSTNASPLEPSQMILGETTQNKHKYFSELSKQEHSILRHVAVEALLSISSQFTREELQCLTQTKKPSTFWEKFRFGGAEKGKSLSVFGADLSEVSKKYGVDTGLGVGPSQLRIPMLVEDIILALRQKDMSVEGIFRLNGNIKNLRELTEQINAAPMKSPNYGNYSAVQLAALMKKWLREMPNPLLTFNLYELWISSRREQNPAKTKRILQLAYCLLPRSHRNLLEVLLYFFSWVASFAEIDEETGSKMDTHNLATVLAPNILLSKAASGENGENQSSDAHFLAIEVVNQLIEIHEDLAVIPHDLWEFYEKCQFNVSGKDSIPTKEIVSKISKISKETPDYFVSFVKKDSYLEPSHHNTIRSGQTKVHEGEKER